MEGTSSPLALLIVACCLQLRVRAYDNGEPARSAVAVVTISMERNLRCPRWQEESKTLELLETTGVDELLYTLRATDSDRLVSAARLMPARQAHFPLVHSQLVRPTFHSSTLSSSGIVSTRHVHASLVKPTFRFVMFSSFDTIVT